jgi:hypothetical protein
MIVSSVSSPSIVRVYSFRFAIRLTLAVNRVSPAAADYLADLFGITQASQRAQMWLRAASVRDQVI